MNDGTYKMKLLTKLITRIFMFSEETNSTEKCVFQSPREKKHFDYKNIKKVQTLKQRLKMLKRRLNTGITTKNG